MAVLRKYNPVTEQWEILQGGVQGLQGPPVALSKGTVTTGAPGTNADFTVTGTPPNQKLNLTVPRGDVGPAGGPIPTGGTPGQFPTPDGAGGYAWSDIAATLAGYHKVGPGDPRTPASTGGVISGTEPNGCTYVSTDGGGVGGYRWVKRAGAWVCVEGDTGPIDLTPVLNADWTASVATWQRINSVVYLRIQGAQGTVNGNIISALPNWMRSAGGDIAWRQGSGGNTVIRASSWYINGQYIGGPAVNNGVGSLINGISPTSFAWPTTLTL